jgi:hypothetical protein
MIVRTGERGLPPRNVSDRGFGAVSMHVSIGGDL